MADVRTHDLALDTLSRAGEIRAVEDDIFTTNGHRVSRTDPGTHVVTPAGQLVRRDTALAAILHAARRTVGAQREAHQQQEPVEGGAEVVGVHGATIAANAAAEGFDP